MAELPAEPRIVARAFGGQVVIDERLPGPASHDGLGLRFVFIAPPGNGDRFALDVESRSACVPGLLDDALGAEPMRRWTEIEVLAKLTNTPALVVLKDLIAGKTPLVHAMQQLEISRCDTPDHWMAVGRWKRC